MTGNRNIFIVAAEHSADLHGSHLVREITAQLPDAQIWGAGGELMRAMGVRTLVDVHELSVMGFTDVLRQLPRLERIFRYLLGECERQKPALAILIDYPGFNLRLARALKQRQIRVGYYISPQLWAWREGRIEKVRRYVDKMAVILPFEKDFYAARGIDVEYVGNPFAEIVQPECSRENFEQRFGAGRKLLLLPGSRDKEILRTLPLMKQIVEKLHGDFSVLVAAAQGKGALIKSLCQCGEVFEGMTYTAMRYSTAALVTSGTATLECLVSQLPAVVLYKIDALSWALGRNLIKVPHIALANLISGERVYTEHIQDINVDAVAAEISTLLFNDTANADLRNVLADKKAILSKGNAAKNAARVFCELMR